MDRKLFKKIKLWFDDYIKEYLEMAPDEDVRAHFKLKAEHTLKVEENIIRLSDSLCLNEGDKDIARVIALFHDIGRFPQYLQYRTFRDADSINHGLLSAEIVENSGILNGLPLSERSIIIESIKFHNALKAPTVTSPQGAELAQSLFLKLIRDADKLDIWRVFSEYFRLPPEQRPSGAVLNLPDNGGVSEEVLHALRERRMALLKDVRNQNDFRLLMLSWVFDLNFPLSFRILKERDYFSIIGDIKDPSAEVVNLIREVRQYIDSEALRSTQAIG